MRHSSLSFRTKASRSAVFIAVALSVLGTAQAGPVQGTLSTSVGDSISSDQLRAWINELIPHNNDRLIVMTQCFGGNSMTSFATDTNTTVISATSPGQTAIYGGYDADAANALKPMAGTTAATVHAAGTAGKHPSETPSNGGGGGAPNTFPLDPIPAMTTMADPIRSRHVLVYAGQPDGGGGTSDVMQRDKIKMNFAGEPMATTTVTSVGGLGGGGWDKPGSAAGLREALKEIGMAITMSPEPLKEQFILYITDHGDLHRKETVNVNAPSTTPNIPITTGFETFFPSQLDPSILAGDPNNIPGFSIFLPYSTPIDIPSATAFSSGAFTLHLDNTGMGADYDLFNTPGALYLDLDGSGFIGDFAGEGVRILFELPHLDSSVPFVDSFFDVFYDVSLSNNTSISYNISEFSQDTGSIAKLVPEPTTFCLAIVGLVGLGWGRRRKKHG